MKNVKKGIALALSIILLFLSIPITTVNASNSYVSQSISIGDCITLGMYNGKPIMWRCVDIDKNGPLMLSVDILCNKEFDAAGASSTYHSDGWGYIRNRSGSNCWSDSSLRQWLNTSGKVNYSHCPPSYSSEDGFLTYFTPDELALVKNVTQKTYVNEWENHRVGYVDGGSRESTDVTDIKSLNMDYSSFLFQNVTDMFFLLNQEQIYSVYTNNSSYVYADSWYYTRIACNTGASYENVQLVGDSTSMKVTGANDVSVGVRPAFYLNEETYNAAFSGKNRREDGFNFYLNYPSNYVNVGSKVELHVGYYLNNILDSSTKQYIYTVSDNSVIAVTNTGWSNSFGQKFAVTAKKEGIASITVTNPSNGDSATLEIYVSPSESGWNFYNIPEMKIEEGKTTNFYNYSGMVIDDFSYAEHLNSTGNIDYYIVTMNIYNCNNLYGAVTSYNSNGSVAGYYVLDKISEFDTGFVDSLKSLYYSCGDLYYLLKNEKYYSGESVSKKTEVTIKVPVGGYLSISNNVKTSEVANLANFCALILDMATFMGDFAEIDTGGDVLDDVKIKVINDVMMKIITNEVVKDELLDCLKNAVAKESKNFDMNYDNVLDSLSAINDKIIKLVGVDLVGEIEESFFSISGIASMGESLLTKALPTGWLIDLLYTENKGLDFAMFFNQYCKSENRSGGIHIYAPNDSSTYQSHGITIESKDTYNDTIIHAYTVVDSGVANVTSNTFGSDITYYSKKYQTYNITLYKNGVEAQPDATVTVKIPVPENFNRATCKVYRNNSDGSLTDMNAYVSNGYIIFETDHFSYYSVVDVSELMVSAELAFSGASLTLQDNLAINYKVSKSLFEETGYTNPYVKFVLNGVETVVTEYTVVDDNYVFDFTDIAPHMINDTVYATLYAEYNGDIFASAVREYSVATYCYNMLEKYTTEEYAELQTLLVDLLNYGSKTQEYLGYQTENLANAQLTEEQAAWGTSAERTYETLQDIQYEVIESPSVLWEGAGLTLQDSITMRFKIAAESIDTLRVKVTTIKGEWFILSSAFEEIEEGSYYVYFDALSAAQMSEPVYLTVYDGITTVSHTIRYSVESYAYAKQNDANTALVELISAMMKYGDSAYAYVN